MEKILIVQYTPRHERSNTKKLLDFAKTRLKGTQIEVIDLEKESPEFFSNLSVTSYALRNYLHEELSEKQKESLKKYDEFTEKFLEADKIIFAYPMYNFTIPSAIKAFMDMILQKGKTWDIGEHGYIGLCQDKEIIVITTSGRVYNEELGNLNLEHNITLMRSLTRLIGAKFSPIFAQGMNIKDLDKDEILDNAKKDIEKIIG